MKYLSQYNSWFFDPPCRFRAMLFFSYYCSTTALEVCTETSGVLGGYTRVYGVYQPPGFFWQRILTSVIINKQGIFRPFATPLCVYPPPFLAIHHWRKRIANGRSPSPFHTYHCNYTARKKNGTDFLLCASFQCSTETGELFHIH